MSLNKAIKHGKERRKAYRGSKSFDHKCRNHGSCTYCESNRLIAALRAEEEARDKIRENLRDDA